MPHTRLESSEEKSTNLNDCHSVPKRAYKESTPVVTDSGLKSSRRMNIISPKWRFRVISVLILMISLALAREPLAQFFFRQGAQAKTEWRLEEAAGHFERALFLKGDFVEARVERGICHQLRGDFLSSQRVLNELSQETIRDTALRARLLNAVGVNRFNANEPDAAIEAHRHSVDLARQLGDRRLEGRGLIDLSRVLYHSKGQADAALELLQQALLIGHETGDELIEADALRNTGVVYWWLKGELDRPLDEYYEPALKIYRRRNDLRSAAITLTNIGHIHVGKGDYLEFLKYQNEALEIKRRVGDLAGLSDSYSALGHLYWGLENYKRASEYFEKGLEVSRRIGYRLTQNDVETQLAKVYRGLGEFDRAIDLLKELPDRERHTPSLAKYRIAYLAECYLLKGEPQLALQHIERALKFEESDPRFKIGALIFQGQIYAELSVWQKASESLARAVEIFQTLDGTYWDGEVLYHVAEAGLAERQGKRALSLHHLLEAAEIESHVLSSDENRFLRGQKRQLYDRLFTLLLEPAPNGDNTSAATPRTEDVKAFHLVEQLRYRAFRNFVAQIKDRKPDLPTAKPKEAQAVVRIERLSAGLRERESPGLREQLRQAYSDYEDLVLQSEMEQKQYRLVREARPAELASVQKALNAETALVEYVFAGDKVFALVITRSTLRSATLPVSTPNLSAKVKLLRSMIFNGRSSSGTSDSDWQPVAEDLRRVLIEPLEQAGALKGVRRLGLVPSGFLHDLPFAALARSEEERARFLIEDYSIFYTPSATYLTSERFLNRLTDAAASRSGEMISFGRDESDEPELPPLQFAAEEARAVASIFGGEVRTGERASETELKQQSQRFKFIHLATHAVSETQMPLLSRLKLQGTREDDGALSVREILELGLKAELVTLGACRTGQSFSSSGGEAKELDRIGLIEAFLHAGAENVLASLLPINDRSTTEFMKAFYQNLRSQSKADALAATQRAMLRGELSYIENNQPLQLTHPRYWAPFILVGDYR